MGLASIIGNVAKGALDLAGLFSQDNAYNKSLAFSREQFEYQKLLHQNQIQWRVSDAQKAGLHPMAALGLSSSSFSPVSTPSVPDYGSGYSNLGDAAASLGQNIDSAIMAGKTKEEREAAQSLQRKAADISLQKGEAELEGIKLENDQKRWFLQQQMFPRTPAVTQNPVIGGQGDAYVKSEPVTVTPIPENSPGKEAGQNPAAGYIQNPDMSVTVVPGEKAKERLEDDFISELGWNAKNRAIPHLRWFVGMDINDYKPPKKLLPKYGVDWRYDGLGNWDPIDAHGRIITPSYYLRKR